MTAQKPAYEVGSSAPLRLPAAAPKPASAAAVGVWTLATSDDFAGDDGDFLANDGDGLLDDADRALATTAPPGV
jgi:hypothetical protein